MQCRSYLLVLAFGLALMGAPQGTRGQQGALTQQQLFQTAMANLDSCERAIWNCCQSTRSNNQLPEQCFARNGCPGLFWHGSRVCSARMLNGIALRIQSTMVEVANSQQPQLRFGYP